MLAVRRSLTEILLEVTDSEVLAVSQEELARYIAAQGITLALQRAGPDVPAASALVLPVFKIRPYDVCVYMTCIITESYFRCRANTCSALLMLVLFIW